MTRRRSALSAWVVWCLVALTCAVVWLLAVVGAVTVLRR